MSPHQSATHCRHMKRQSFLCNGRPCCGRHHCHCRHHLRHCCRLCCHCHCRCCCNRPLPLPLPLPLAIAVAVPVNHHRRHLCCVAVSHCCLRHPCCWPLPPPSPSAIAVAIAISHHRCHSVDHFQELLLWHGKNCIQPIEAKNAYLNLFCSDSGRRID